MELRDIVNEYGIVGIVSNYKSSLEVKGKISDLNIKNINEALKMVLLDESYKDKYLEELTLNELWKVELATKLNNDIIMVGNLSLYLNYKDIEYMKKLFIKLNNSYNKKIIVFENDIRVFFNLAKRIIVLRNKEVIYETSDFFDKELYNYVKCPKIIDFINYINKDQKLINNTIEIYELIKDIYRSVS